MKHQAKELGGHTNLPWYSKRWALLVFGEGEEDDALVCKREGCRAVCVKELDNVCVKMNELLFDVKELGSALTPRTVQVYIWRTETTINLWQRTNKT